MALLQRLVTLGIVCFVGLSFLKAAEKEEPSRVTAVWLDGRRASGELFIKDAKGDPQKLPVGVSARGKPVDLPVSAATIVLLRKTAAVPAAGTAPTFEPAGEVALPSGRPRKVILLLAASGQGGTPMSVKGVALADDLAAFPVHSVRFANFLGSELASRVGNSVKTVPPGSSVWLPYPVYGKSDSTAIPVFPLAFARSDKSGRTELFFNGRIEAWANSRALVVVFPGPTAEADPVVRTILEIVPPLAAPGSAKLRP